MRVDFYQLGAEPAERTVPLLAAKALQTGHRVLVVANDPAWRKAIGTALWAEPADFLANGEAGGPHDSRQPVLLADECEASNGARLIILADGEWRDGALAFERTLLLFGDQALHGARQAWRELGNREDVERRFWKRDGGRWVEGP